MATEPDKDLKTIIQEQMTAAVSWREEHLDDEQEKATEYYKGKEFGNEEEGRSQVVLTPVRDTVQAYLPSLMRIFFNPERPVEFEPRNPEKQKQAEQATEYVSYIVAQDNNGFTEIRSAMLDALVRKLGIIKWWWDDSEQVEAEQFTGLTEAEVFLLMSEENVEVEVNEIHPSQTELDQTTFDVTAMRVVEQGSEGRARFMAVPPEEFFWNPEARSLEDADFVAHQRAIASSSAIAMGVPEDMVEDHQRKSTKHALLDATGLKAARRLDEGSGALWGDRTVEDQVLVTEAWVHQDNRIRKIIAIGPDYEIWEQSVVSERPFALFCPDPEPHAFVGNSIADYVMDLQKIESQIARGMLDSLALSLDPERVVNEDHVSMADVMSRERSKIIRTDTDVNNAIREITTPFVGEAALPVMQFFEAVRENRTGISKAAAGLDADALQSATKAAVAATLSGAQQHIEMVARTFAETGFTQLFKGLLRLVVQNQNRQRIIRLRGEFVPIDPRYWNADMDIRVNVGLGQGTPEDKINTMNAILEKQLALMEQGSPLVSNVEIRNTLARMAEIAGEENPNKFFKPWTTEQEQQLQQQMAQQPPPPDPEMELLELEKKRFQAETAKEQRKLALEREKMLLEDDRKRDEQAQQAAIEEFRIEKKHDADIRDTKLKEKIAERRSDNSNSDGGES